MHLMAANPDPYRVTAFLRLKICGRPHTMQAVWMIASSFLFATMGVCVKYASQHFNSAELVFYRGVLGIFFMAAYARATGTSCAPACPPCMRGEASSA